jgi:3-phytase
VRKAAEILRRVQPDIVLVNEIDYSVQPDCAQRFAEIHLAGPRGSLAPLDLPYRVYLPVNTGVPSGFDFNNDGDSSDPEDAVGYGRYPGQYGMALFSRFPIETGAVRSFQRFLWKDMPGHVMPDGRGGRPAHYSPEEVQRFRLSSKSHWDVPVQVGGRVIHLLASHPTPPIFDGPEDANGRRTFDEIRLWADYLAGGSRADYLVDDQGRRGGLAASASFVLLGDLNADPVQEREQPYGRSAISQVLEHPRLQDPRPTGDGPWPADPARPYPGDSRTRTTTFGRIDYVLPSRDLSVVGAGVWHPPAADPLSPLVAPPDPASDHRLVWVDVRLPD